MKPLIIGMGPSPSYPSQPWHPQAVSTKNLCWLITGNPAAWPEVERSYEVIDLNKHWHRLEGIGDSVQVSEAKETLTNLIENGALRGGRKTFLLGEQVTNFVFEFLRRPGSALVEDAW